MSKIIYGLGILSAVACSSGAARMPARPAPATLVVRAAVPAAVAKNEAASAPIEYRDQGADDRVFIENAERAIGEYSEFIARAGESKEYALAVKRSREQIEDLRDSLLFIREGAAQRAAH